MNRIIIYPTPNSRYIVNVEGYKPRHWQVTKGHYQIRLLFEFTAICDGTRPTTEIWTEWHRYTLKDKIYSGRNANLERGINDTLKPKVTIWTNKAKLKAMEKCEARGSSLKEFSYVIKRFLVIRLSGSKVPEKTKKDIKELHKEMKRGKPRKKTDRIARGYA